MNSIDLKARTKKFALMIIDLVEVLPNTISCRVIANQIAKSGTSVGANYRAVCRARSDREFVAKMTIVIEEADETLFWIEIIQDKKWADYDTLNLIWKEGNELTAIFVATIKKVKTRLNDSKS